LVPSLAATAKHLYLAWKEGDDSLINLLTITEGESPRDAPIRLEEARSGPWLSLASVMGPGGCHEEGTTWRHE
jgi:hypothetical protein